ncbi:hypothetical protein QZH41_006681 [Actinostola sp. cb2023]|nr:hypothetical protein QZH41_006681 [Actinostola sp. cb2023]
MEPQDATNRRRNAKAKFTRKRTELSKAMDEGKALDVIKRIFMDYNEAWVNVKAKHDHYLTFLNDQECLNEEPWIDELQQLFTESMERESSYEQEIKARQSLIKQQANQKDEEDKRNVKSKKLIEETQMKRKVKEQIFMQILDDLKTLLTKADEDSDVKGIAIKTTKELKSALDDCKESNDAYMTLLDQAEDVTNEIMWIKRMQKLYNMATDEIEEKIAKCQKRVSSNIRMEKIKLPTFDGNIRNYARFKSDFQKHVMPSLSKDAAPYTL